MCSAVEGLLQPLFVVQSRVINQNQNFKVFRNSWDMVQRCGIRSMWAGWGSILPRQAILSAWAMHIPEISNFLGGVLGDSSGAEGFISEAIVGIGGFLLVYPLFTASRRVAVCGNVVGMSKEKYSGVAHALYKISREEGILQLFRGIGSYTAAVSGI